MIKIDFTVFSHAELNEAQVLLSHELQKRRDEERDRLFEEFAALARARGFAINDVVRRASGHTGHVRKSTAKRVRRPAPIKFRHPDQPSLTWTGRGKTPRWINEWVKQGRALTELGA
jgi:DNA-binding protein H-NS